MSNPVLVSVCGPIKTPVVLVHDTDGKRSSYMAKGKRLRGFHASAARSLWPTYSRDAIANQPGALDVRGAVLPAAAAEIGRNVDDALSCLTSATTLGFSVLSAINGGPMARNDPHTDEYRAAIASIRSGHERNIAKCLHHNGLHPIASQVCVASIARHLGTSIDLVCVPAEFVDDPHNANRIFVVEVKVVTSTGYLYEYNDMMCPPLGAMTNSLENQFKTQAAYGAALFRASYPQCKPTKKRKGIRVVPAVIIATEDGARRLELDGTFADEKIQDRILDTCSWSRHGSNASRVKRANGKREFKGDGKSATSQSKKRKTTRARVAK